MASSITVVQLSPSAACFYVALDAGTPITFQQSGAVGVDKDLSALLPGPLKTYLTRLADWGALAIGSFATPNHVKVRLRPIATSTVPPTMPVAGGTSAVGAVVIKGSATSIVFNPIAGANVVQYEMAFVHSAQR
jgi:hypothetical protein